MQRKKNSKMRISRAIFESEQLILRLKLLKILNNDYNNKLFLVYLFIFITKLFI